LVIRRRREYVVTHETNDGATPEEKHISHFHSSSGEVEGILTDEGELLFASGKAYLRDTRTQEVVRAPHLDTVGDESGGTEEYQAARYMPYEEPTEDSP
jgi:hypothetical protein